MTIVPGTVGIQLTQFDLAALALHEGLSIPQATIATAIAMAENQGSFSGPGGSVISNVLNPTAPDYSIGPWQINYRLGTGGTVVSSRNGYSQEQTADPFINAKQMMAVSGNGNNWNPWSTYTNNAYLLFMV